MTPLWIVAALIAAALAVVAVVWTRLSRRRVQATTGQRVRAIPAEQWEDEALAIVEQAKADHINAAMQAVEHPYTHLTAEEAADCRTCSPSSLPRRIEEDT